MIRTVKNVPTIPMFFLGFALVLLAAPAFAATGVVSPLPPLRADEARANQGQNVVVQGTVADTHKDQRFGIYIDIDSNGPSPVFAGFIPKGNEQQFPDTESLKGHLVTITGVIRIREGYPIIQMTEATQLNILR